MTTPIKHIMLALAPFVLSLTTSVAVCTTTACSPAATATAIKTGQTVVDVADAVCQALEANDIGPDQVQIVCKYVSTVDGLSHIFLAKVSTSQAMAMGIHTPNTVALAKTLLAPIPSAPVVALPAPSTSASKK